ncbi:hypothetical protein SAMN04489797_3089 [Winogradskyella sediminis]|uniref:Uncharacterized protein n=1 Tax=Winogradskyella sediminis TaxID=1382466 RepID=A0A1H1X3R1_9FLAO|nr:hypothetical protein SAMN04489797_3089 [Winogradskyella sediminis]
MGKTLKIISLTSYSLIFLMGQMIGLPFIFWLIFTSFEFGNSDQIFAIFGLIGVILNFTKHSKSRLGKILSFVLMLTPIARRMTEIPIEKFNYLAFQIPLLLFVITYLIYILKQNENKKTVHNTV